MNALKNIARAIPLMLPLALLAVPSFAQDKLKVAIGQINNWENQVPTLGMQAGIFQKHKLELENFGTQGAGETLQPIISGSADIGIGVGTSGAMRAFAKGAPVRALAAGCPRRSRSRRSRISTRKRRSTPIACRISTR